MFTKWAIALQRLFDRSEPVEVLDNQPGFTITLVDGDVIHYPSTDIKITRTGFVYTKVKGRWVHTPDIVGVVYNKNTAN